ncbi:MAG: ferrous iron transport protein B [Bdellovibrionota bacterium]
MTTLSNLQVGKSAYITKIDCSDKLLRRRILHMGLTPKVEVKLVKKAPLGDPLQVLVRGYELTIRKDDAEKILIDDIHDDYKWNTTNYKKGATKEIEHPKKGESSLSDASNINCIAGSFNFALVGNQNSGKTTLFNELTKSNQHVGNFPGVTVERKEGAVKRYPNITITDLPGVYTLSPFSNEEIVTRNYLINSTPDLIINIIDATNIERNLFLTLELMELQIPMVIALNMMDEIVSNRGKIDINGLERDLGIPVVPISASKREGLEELLEHSVNIAVKKELPKKLDFCRNDNEKNIVHKCVHSIMHLLENRTKQRNLPVRFAATKIIENDPFILKALDLDANTLENCKQIVLQMEEEKKLEKDAILADMRFSFIEELCKDYVCKPCETKEHKLSTKLDKILTGRYSAIPMFLGILSIIFYLTFGPLGGFLAKLMQFVIDKITNITDITLTNYGLNASVHSLIIDGVFAGVGSVLIFLPTIIVLFFFLSILEDTGYMARVAFVMDKILRKIGLSGRSFVPMILGFGCSVPAIMATRTLPSERDRKITIFLTPFMSCSAKLPIYVLFTAVFFKEYQVLVIISLYLLGIFVGIIAALLLKILVFKGEPVPFVMELPNYRLPTATNIYKLIWKKAKGFITKAFSIIFIATIVIWFLQNFDTRLNLVKDAQNSLLALLGNIFLPIFKPLGMNDWRIGTSLITGLIAKESVISTFSVLLNGDISKLSTLFNNLTAFVFLTFSLLYTPCVATIAITKQELGKKHALFIAFFQCAVAWIVSFIIYELGLIFMR